MQIEDDAADLRPGSQFNFVRALRLGREANMRKLAGFVRIGPVVLPLQGQELSE